MKTQFTPIAMKCNQEQFEAIKPKLEENGCEIYNVSLLCMFPNLVNNFNDIEKKISNCSEESLSNNRTYYPEWNEEIFLNACGIETQPKRELTEEQLNYLLSIDSIKDEVKKWFGIEDNLEVGKWYKNSRNILAFCSKIISKTDFYGYGFGNGDRKWFDEDGIPWVDENWILATPKEVEEALTKEAVKRYEKGCKVKGVVTETILNINLENLVFYYDDNELYCDGVQIFRKGIWAEIIEDKTPSDIQELINKYGKNELLKLLKDE